MSFSRAAAWLAVAGLALLLAACGSVPRPFSPAGKGGAVPPPGPSTALIVHPAVGADRAALDMLTDMVVEELRAREVAAIRYEVPDRYRLVGQAAAGPAQDGTATMTLQWQLLTPDGAPVETVAYRQDVDWASYRQADPFVIRQMARAAIGEIGAMLGFDAPPEAREAGPRLILDGARGAPGDGNAALASAMAHELGRFEVAVDDGRGGARLPVLRALVEVRAMDEANELVTITWLLHDAEGKERGRLQQQNRVAKGRLDRRWGVVAKLAAAAAAPEIADLLRRFSP